MKNSGLSNRFSQEVRQQWIYWYSCLICGRNRWDALHHIISPSVRFYKVGKHNESILNSCPIHNFKCHIDNEHILFNDITLSEILEKTFLSLVELGYTLKQIDLDFLEVYRDWYNWDKINSNSRVPF